MPIFIPAATANPPAPTVMQSPDRILTASTFGGGVFLHADFAEQVLGTNILPDPSFEYGLGGLANASGSTVQQVGKTVTDTNLITNPDGTTNSWWDVIAGGGTAATSYGAGYAEATWSVAATGNGGLLYSSGTTFDPGAAMTAGDMASVSCQVWLNRAITFRVYRQFMQGTTMLAQDYIDVPVPANSWTTIKLNSATVAPANTNHVRLLFYNPAGWQAGDIERVRYVTLVKAATASDPFSGDTPTSGSNTYAWTGPVGASTSTHTYPNPVQPYSGNYMAKITAAAVNGSSRFVLTNVGQYGFAAGDKVTFAARVYLPAGFDPYASSDLLLGMYGTAPSDNVRDYGVAPTDRDRWVWVWKTWTIGTPTGSLQPTFFGAGVVGQAFYVDTVGLSKGTDPADFSGDTPTNQSIHYRWTGPAGASSSEEYVPGITGVKAVRFTRSSDGVLVRSGNDRVAVGGKANAFDFEAPLGAGSTWTATPIMDDGTTGAPSQGAALELPLPTDPLRKWWLKSVAQPSLSMTLRLMQPLPTPSAQAPLVVSNVLGRALPSVAWNVASPQPIEFVIRTATIAERNQLYALFNAGPMLFQGSPVYGIDDFYCVAASWQETYLNFADNPERVITVTLQPVAAPDPYGAPLVVPARTYADLKSQGSYSNVQTTYTTYQKVASPV